MNLARNLRSGVQESRATDGKSDIFCSTNMFCLRSVLRLLARGTLSEDAESALGDHVALESWRGTKLCLLGAGCCELERTPTQGR